MGYNIPCNRNTYLNSNNWSYYTSTTKYGRLWARGYGTICGKSSPPPTFDGRRLVVVYNCQCRQPGQGVCLCSEDLIYSVSTSTPNLYTRASVIQL